MTDLPNHDEQITADRGTNLLTAMKLVAASALFYSAGSSLGRTYHASRPSADVDLASASDSMASPTNNAYQFNSLPMERRQHHRRLAEDNKGALPSYMEDLMEDLKSRKKLMEETPPEEVKYWFEYTGPLQVSLFCILSGLLLMDLWRGGDRERMKI